MIDAYASWRHYADHLAPVWAALPEESRGCFYATPEVITWLSRPTAPVRVEASPGFPDRAAKHPVLVAGFTDHHAVRPRQTVLLNHGAGQSYLGSVAKGNECYSGGPGRERVLLHLEPGPLAAKRTADAGQPFVEVGAPKLDPWHVGRRVMPSDPVVAFGFHHEARGCAEQRSALPYYREAIEALSGRVTLLGHGHPRGWERTANWWSKLGVEAEPDFARVLDRATVYVTDTSSTGVEFASTGRPVIFCSAPWYRRDIDHGGRFWDWTDHALHVQDPADLATAVRVAQGWPALLERQQAIVESVYCATDGRATERAVAAVVDLVS